ncbi:DUF461 domain-containing protein [Streptomyces sp. NPDC002851]
MSRSLRRGAIAATALAFSLATLSACGAGNEAQTLGVQPDHAATSVGDIKIQNALVITQPDREATGPAAVAATVFNEGRKDQTLESIKVGPSGKTAELKPAKGSGPIVVPAGGSVVIGGKGNASASLPNSSEELQGSSLLKVTFGLSTTGDVTLEALVAPATGYFQKWGPSDVPAAPDGKPTPDAKPTKGTKPSAPASGEPAEGATEGASDAASESPAQGASGAATPGAGH